MENRDFSLYSNRIFSTAGKINVTACQQGKGEKYDMPCFTQKSNPQSTAPVEKPSPGGRWQSEGLTDEGWRAVV